MPTPPTRSASQRPVAVATADIAVTRDVLGPLVVEDGLLLDSVWLVSTGIVPGTFTFQPFYYLKGTKRFLSAPLSTTNLVFAAGVPLRLHKEERLVFPLPEGALCGVTVTRASGTLLLPTFNFVLTGG